MLLVPHGILFLLIWSCIIPYSKKKKNSNPDVCHQTEAKRTLFQPLSGKWGANGSNWSMCWEYGKLVNKAQNDESYTCVQKIGFGMDINMLPSRWHQRTECRFYLSSSMTHSPGGENLFAVLIMCFTLYCSSTILFILLEKYWGK